MSAESATLPPSMNFGQKLLNSIIKPQLLFQTISTQKGNAWIIFGLLAIVLTVLPIIVSGPLQRQQIIEQFEATNSQFPIEEGAPDPTQFIANPITTTVLPAVFAGFGLIAGWLIWSGALHLISSLTGGRNSFLQMLRVVVWSWIPYSIRAILQTIYISSTNILIENPGLSGLVNTGVSPDNPFAVTSPGVLALQTFLQGIEIYLFWRLALLIVGIAIVAQLPRRKAIGAVIIVWATFTLIAVGFSAGVGTLSSSLVG